MGYTSKLASKIIECFPLDPIPQGNPLCNIYVCNQFQGKMLRIPDESEGEFVHLIFKDTIPQLHIIAVYLYGKKGNQDKTSRTWHLLENKDLD